MNYKRKHYILLLCVMRSEKSESRIQTLIENCINYAKKHNNSKTNWIARELFEDVLEEDLIKMLFDEE